MEAQLFRTEVETEKMTGNEVALAHSLNVASRNLTVFDSCTHAHTFYILVCYTWSRGREFIQEKSGYQVLERKKMKQVRTGESITRAFKVLAVSV